MSGGSSGIEPIKSPSRSAKVLRAAGGARLDVDLGAFRKLDLGVENHDAVFHSATIDHSIFLLDQNISC